MASSDEDVDELEHKQRLKAALHYTVGEVCSEVEGAVFTREVLATITETAFKQCEVLAVDLEQFAKHAKRTTVSMEDVKLCARRSSSLSQFITEQAEKLKAEREQESAKRSRGNKKQTAASVVDD